MRLSRTYVALLLVFLLVPGAFEATENLVHLATSGTLAHSGNDSSRYAPGAEHDCSGVFHTCACHSSVLVTVPAEAKAPAADLPDLGSPLDRDTRLLASGFPDRLYRPPIA